MNTYYETAVPYEVFTAFTVAFSIIGIIFAVVVIGHIIDAIALMKLGKRFNVKNSWLAWIPVGDQYVVGSLATVSDENKGRVRKWGTILPILSAITLLSVPFFVIYMCTLIASEAAPDAFLTGETMIILLVCYLILLVTSIASSLFMVFNAVCVFKIFEHLNSKKAVKYFILSILVPFADGILLLKCEKKLAEAEEASVCEE